MPDKLFRETDTLPSLADLRAAFKYNDFSAAKSREYDYDNLSAEDIEDLEFIDLVKTEMRKQWTPLAREMGFNENPAFYQKDHPLIALQENLEQFLATKALDLMEQQPDELWAAVADSISYHAPNPEESLTQQFEALLQHPEKFLPQAQACLSDKLKLTMEAMQYEEIAKIIKQQPAHEDFRQTQQQNFRATDFERQWNHTRTATKTISLEELQENSMFDSGCASFADPNVKIEDEVGTEIAIQRFMASLSAEDKLLLKLRMDGHSLKDIATKLGCKTHSAITKRLQKLEAKLKENL